MTDPSLEHSGLLRRVESEARSLVGTIRAFSATLKGMPKRIAQEVQSVLERTESGHPMKLLYKMESITTHDLETMHTIIATELHWRNPVLKDDGIHTPQGVIPLWMASQDSPKGYVPTHAGAAWYMATRGERCDKWGDVVSPS